MKGTLAVLLLAVIFVAMGGALWHYRNVPMIAAFLGTHSPQAPVAVEQEQPVNTVTFACDLGKTITAAFYNTPASTTAQAAPSPAGAPPQPQGHVELTLSDGRTLSLPQTLSGSGIRYASADESVVFWSKGNTAFIQETPNQTQTYSGCIVESALPGEGDWNTYASSTLGVSVRYPQGYRVTERYAYTGLGPSKPSVQGVKLLIPQAIAAGTNLSGFDTGVSVEVLPASTSTTCTADQFLAYPSPQRTLTDNGTDYSVASSSSAGAGNFYQEIVYALKDSMPCTAVRYFIHSTNIGNYTPGTVKEYDRAALLSQFDQIRQSLVLGR